MTFRVAGIALLITAFPDSRVLALCPDSAAVAAYLADIAAARISQGFGSALTLSDAECARDKLARELPRLFGPRVGYKAAFTNASAQERNGLKGPAWAVLFSNQLVESGATVPARFGAQPRYEPDLVVVVKDSGLASANSPLEALEHLEAVVPFIELPDLMLSDAAVGTALIATNIGSRGGVLGSAIRIEPTETFLTALGTMTIVTEDDSGKELGRARGDLLMGHPMNVAMWLAKALRGAGVTLKRGDLLSLGGFRPPAAPVPGTTLTVRYIGLPGNAAVTVHFR